MRYVVNATPFPAADARGANVDAITYKPPPSDRRGLCVSRGDWVRTSDLTVPNRARYQLRHTPRCYGNTRAQIMLTGGDGGIRTRGTRIGYGSLANYWFQPLTHVTGHTAQNRFPEATQM